MADNESGGDKNVNWHMCIEESVTEILIIDAKRN